MELFPLSGISSDPHYSGGFSGLHFEPGPNKDELIFWVHSDRGPNAEEIEEGDVVKRPFLRPGFQPFWQRFSLNRVTKEVSVLEVVHLTMASGRPISGLPNKEGDEIPLDINGNILPWDINGIDPEAICYDGKFVWMGEEYGPSLLKFTRDGNLLKRYVPAGSYQGSDPDLFCACLPSEIARRKVNRGFEGLTCMRGKVYAMLQSPLKGEGLDVRILEFNPETEKIERQYFYPLDSLEADKIGDLAVYQGELLVLEQNGVTGPEGIHMVYAVDLTKASDSGKLKKRPVKDLVKVGYSFAEKVEGMTVVHDSELAIVNDNDFGVNDPTLTSILAILRID